LPARLASPQAGMATPPSIVWRSRFLSFSSAA
jgi:hypothetical protein